MSSQSFRWRTIIEVAIISIVIYVVIGSPGLSTSYIRSTTKEKDVPTARAKAESLVYPNKDLKCPRHDFDIHILSTSPLVIYINRFVSESEAQHLIDIRHVTLDQFNDSRTNSQCSSNKWQVSTVFNEGVESTDESVRKSEKALIDRDETVQCIEVRFLQITHP